MDGYTPRSLLNVTAVCVLLTHTAVVTFFRRVTVKCDISPSLLGLLNKISNLHNVTVRGIHLRRCDTLSFTLTLTYCFWAYISVLVSE